MAEEILNLSTVVDRPTMSITSKKHPKGKSYELVTLADLGPYEFAIVFQRSQELQEITAAGKKPTPTQERQAARMLDDTIKLICPSLEPAVLAELKPQQKQFIVFGWTAKMREGAAEGNPTRRRRTTAASSRGSKRSTAATRKPGSTRPAGS